MSLLLLLLAQVAAPTAPLPMPDFLTGCWIATSGDRWTEECWTPSNGGLMLGSNRDGNGDAIRMWEWMRVERAPDGAIAFHASPKGAKPSAFPMVRSNADEILFENRSHDFPQRILYRRSGDAIEAEVSLADGSNPLRWTFRRMASPAVK